MRLRAPARANDGRALGNGYVLLGLDPLYEQITMGAILLAAVGLDVWTRQRRT